MDVLGAIALGPQVQQRDKTAHVAARLSIRETRGFSHRLAERTFAKGDRETREHSCRLKARHRRKKLLRVRNHIRARLSYGWAEVLDAEPHLGSEALRPHREEDPKARTPEGGAVDGMAHRRSGRAPAPGEVAPDPDVAHSALSDRSDDLPSCDCSI